MVEGPAERAASKGMVRQRTFTKEEQRNSNTNTEETQDETNTGVQEVSWPERRQRKQWRSQGGLPASEKIGQSPILDDFFLKEKERCSSGSSYGGVVPLLRLRLAEQGDPTAQLEIAREVLLRVAGGQVPETEVAAQEEVAVYWLLRAAEQGDSEAQETLVALAGEGRGVTEHNYVDVAALVNVAPNIAQGQFLGRTLFRTLSRGQEHVTAVQLARRAGAEGVVANHRLLAGRIGRAELERSCCDYLQGKTPSLHLAMEELATPCLPERLLRKRVILPFLLFFIHCLPLLHRSLSFLQTPSLMPSLLLFSSLSLHSIHYRTSAHSLWSRLLTSVSSSLDSKSAESKCASRTVLLPSLIFHLILLQPTLLAATSPLTLLLSGCLLSAIALPRPRLTLLFLLLGQAGAATWWDQLAPLLTSLGTNCSLSLASTSILCTFLLPSILFLPSAEFQSHLQAVAWELLLLSHLQPSFDPLLPLKLLGSLGLLHASLLSLRLHQHRLLLLLVVSAVVWPHLPPPAKPPVSSLTWQEYRDSCLTPTSPHLAATCTHLSGLQVAWSGQVAKVQLHKRRNPVEELVKALPDTFLHLLPLTCLVGERYKHCPSSSLSASSPSSLVCRLRREKHLPAWQTCHLESWATYSYSITMRMAATAIFGGQEELVKLEVEGMPKLAEMAEGTLLQFTGQLRLSLEEPTPSVIVTHMNIR